MMALSELLEGFDDGQKVLVSLKNGDEFVLYDFEMVDESIYDRNDLVVASISDVTSSKCRYRNGTKLEFALGDIATLKDPITGNCYFKV
jgi:hypothetical protein